VKAIGSSASSRCAEHARLDASSGVRTTRRRQGIYRTVSYAGGLNN
jgi:hypothetical protein